MFIDIDTEGAVYRSRLSNQSESVNPRRDVRKQSVVVAPEKVVLGVAVHCRKAEKVFHH